MSRQVVWISDVRLDGHLHDWVPWKASLEKTGGFVRPYGNFQVEGVQLLRLYGCSKNMGTPKWMVYIGKCHERVPFTAIKCLRFGGDGKQGALLEKNLGHSKLHLGEDFTKVNLKDMERPCDMVISGQGNWASLDAAIAERQRRFWHAPLLDQSCLG